FVYVEQGHPRKKWVVLLRFLVLDEYVLAPNNHSLFVSFHLAEKGHNLAPLMNLKHVYCLILHDKAQYGNQLGDHVKEILPIYFLKANVANKKNQKKQRFHHFSASNLLFLLVLS